MALGKQEGKSAGQWLLVGLGAAGFGSALAFVLGLSVPSVFQRVDILSYLAFGFGVRYVPWFRPLGVIGLYLAVHWFEWQQQIGSVICLLHLAAVTGFVLSKGETIRTSNREAMRDATLMAATWVIGTLALADIVFKGSRDVPMAVFGAKATATVESFDWDVQDDDRRTTYFGNWRYRFKVGSKEYSGADWEPISGPPKDGVEGAMVGQPLKVVYFRGNPSWNGLANRVNASFLGGLVFLALYAGAGVLTWRWALKESFEEYKKQVKIAEDGGQSEQSPGEGRKDLA